METPKSERQLRPVRKPTPRLSERKKSLFTTKSNAEEDEDDPLEGISLLKPKRSSDNTTPKKKSSIEALMKAKSSRVISFLDAENEVDNKYVELSPKRRSGRLSVRRDLQHVDASTVQNDTNGKENVPMGENSDDEAPEEQLQKLFSSSMRLGAKAMGPKTPTRRDSSTETDSMAIRKAASAMDASEQHNRDAIKRHCDSTPSSGLSPQRKMTKVAAMEPVSISTKSFYSTHKSRTSATTSKASSVSPPSVSNFSPRSKRKEQRRSLQASINKGVRHKIRRPPRTIGAPVRTLPPTNIDLILSNMRNEKLRNLITAKRAEKMQIEKVHNIFRSGKNPIAMAKPLSTIDAGNSNDNNNNDGGASEHAETFGIDFSDIECDSDDLIEELDDASSVGFLEETIPLIAHETVDAVRPTTPSTTRKFFKSGRSGTRMEVKITDNIRAAVCNGRISLVEGKKKIRKRYKRSETAACEFSDEQATVDAILKNLDDTAFGDVIVEETENNKNRVEESTEQLQDTSDDILGDIQLQDVTDYAEFRNRLPYNTSDSNLIEQQHLLLDFLISNNICNEENFNIFIADPDNHKEEAARIVDQLIIVVNEQSELELQEPLTYSDSNELVLQIADDVYSEDNSNMDNNSEHGRIEFRPDTECAAEQSEIATEMDYAGFSKSTSNEFEDIKHVVAPANDNGEEQNANSESEKLFPIFNNARWQPINCKSTRRIQRNWHGGEGATQYQIDAGQRNFGAQQCKQCGLVYTVHEPEEEKLHRDYHASLHVLRFKGWIDEDIVAIYPEWGADGRILRISESSHIKRRERLMDVLKIVDKELGFSSYIIPKTFVAYFAVRKSQIVGLCLVQPLEKANKYMSINGIDCCSEEEFEAKCGISRIWVSPFHRRLRIASKLMQAVQVNTIFGEEIPPDKIAFSAPTESGKIFAQKITQTENFLVYQ